MDDQDHFGRLGTAMLNRFAGQLDRDVIASETLRTWLAVRSRYASPFGPEVVEHIVGHLVRLVSARGVRTDARSGPSARRRGRELSVSSGGRFTPRATTGCAAHGSAETVRAAG